MDNPKNTATADYEVTRSREIGGIYRDEGDVIPLTPAQAKYYLPPYGTGLKPVAAKPVTRSKVDAEKPAAKADGPDA